MLLVATHGKFNDPEWDRASSSSSMDEDGVSPSEREYLSSDWEEILTNEDLSWVKPQSKSQKTLNENLGKFISHPNDTKIAAEEKKEMRRQILSEHRHRIEKKKAKKELTRLGEIVYGEYEAANLTKKVGFLVKQEFRDKKLHRGYYYSPDEPETYKHLLRKRRKAIYNKYVAFLKDPEGMSHKLLEKNKMVLIDELQDDLNTSSVVTIREGNTPIKDDSLFGLSWDNTSTKGRHSTPKKSARPNVSPRVGTAPTKIDFGAVDGNSARIKIPEKLNISPLQLFHKTLVQEGDLLRKRLHEEKNSENLPRKDFQLEIIQLNRIRRPGISAENSWYLHAFDCLKMAEVHSDIDILSQKIENCNLEVSTCLGKSFVGA
ncbi:hypothetical protein DMENIID0001_122200 [Sergentomyia squamirostris]